MDKDRVDELMQARAHAEQELERLRSAVTILFSDIKGSTAYFEKKGDHEGLAMVQRHNELLMPRIVECGGRVVKTIGDSIMACFSDPVGAVKAAAEMQRALQTDRAERSEAEQIHIRVGLHTGLGLLKDHDVYGDVVNAAFRVQQQAQPDQIIITDLLLDAAKTAGFQVVKLGKGELRGKDEPIDLYAMSWSDFANEQLVEELQAQYERKFKDLKRVQEQTEEDLETARDQWRSERRRMNKEIEQLEESIERARAAARQQASEDLQSEIRFQLEDALSSRLQAEEEFAASTGRWEVERNRLRAQMASMQGAIIESMERSNNPSRTAMAVREQVDARMSEAQKEWQFQWEGERKRLTAEIERLRKSAGLPDEKIETARRAILEKLGKLPAGSVNLKTKSADQWESEFNQAKIQWETERDQLNLKIQKAERDLQRNTDAVRSESFQEMRASYEPKLAVEQRERASLEEELAHALSDLASERLRLTARIQQLEKALPDAQEAVRRQTIAEMQAEMETKLEESNRVKSRLERRSQDAAEEADAERRRDKKQIGQLEEQLKEARETAFKAHRSKSV